MSLLKTKVLRADIVERERFVPAKASAAQKAGLAYERRVARELEREYGYRFQREPCYEYETKGGRGRCFPDALLCFGDRLVVIEVKLSHCLGAWKQLRGLYQPVVSVAHGLPVQVVEISRSYDPDVSLPEPHVLLLDPGQLSEPSDEYRVLRWKI